MMAQRADLVEAALDVYPEGIALLDAEERVVFWNRAAERVTGYAGMQLIGRTLPAGLRPLGDAPFWEPRYLPQVGTGAEVHLQHHCGRDEAVAARRVLLRDSLGGRMGTAAVFHLAERGVALPHGETSEGSEVQQSQAALDERLAARFDAFGQEGRPLGLLWITVDQAAGLRKTHGARACEAMLESVERTLANALRAGYEIGRWGDDEFLVLADEPDEQALSNRGLVMTGIARTTDFSWWGDRVTLTVSVGAARVESGEDLAGLLERAQRAMRTSVQSGGNQVTRGAARSRA